LPTPPASNLPVHSTTGKIACNRELAYLLLRLTLGVNILMHGLSRILSGVAPFAAGMMKQFASTPLPAPLVHAFAIVLPWSELCIGIAIFLGLWTRFALALGAMEIVVLTFGIALTQNWAVAGIQIVYAVVYAILLAFGESDRWSVDGWRARRRNSRPPS
jgi:thiosulfate dehydrogenase [quinone] large subunit